MDDETEDSEGSGESAGADWVTLYQRNERSVYQQCFAQLRNHADAEDAVQEAFLRAGPRLGDVSGDPVHYVSVVARNVCRDELRRRSAVRAAALAEAGKLNSVAGHVEVDCINRADIQKGWAVLTGRERSLVSRSFAGFTRTETARTMRMSSGAVNVALVRARHRVRGIAQVRG